MSNSNYTFDLDTDDDHQAIMPDGRGFNDVGSTHREKFLAQKKLLDARRAVDQLHDERRVMKELQSADLFLSCDKADLLTQLR